VHSHIGDMDDDWSTRADEGEACANNLPPPLTTVTHFVGGRYLSV